MTGEEVFVASANHVQRWNWITGTSVDEPTQLPAPIQALAPAASLQDPVTSILYAVCQDGEKSTIVMGTETIYTSTETLNHFQVKGSYVIAATSTMLVVGRRSLSGDATSHEFVEIDLASGLTCLDCKVEATESKKQTKSESLSVAVGNTNGAIYLYENILSSGKPSEQSLTPRTLHWHREAVGCVKWSRDNNYLISGGKETVLVLWQLATGKKQFLPHLTAEIERLTVSPSGSSYAIQLADNSLMVLSTTELKPIANFAGLQAQSVEVLEKGKKSHLLFQNERGIVRSAAALNPQSPDELLITVPPSSSDFAQTTSPAPRPFLQTFDIASDRHISRQALTRNNVTDFNKGPEGNKIRVPDVAFLQISHDGKWLATAEEWAPPSPDVEFLAADRPANDEQRLFRREIYLKIWRWDETRSVWALESRIDSPHQLNGDSQPGRILSLVADPVEVGFASVGEDSCVRIWKPKTRTRNGIVVRGTESEGLVDWSCRHSIPLDRSVELADIPQQPKLLPPPAGAVLAYSEDGSALAVSQAFEDAMATPVVHFINTTDGATSETRSGLFTGTIKAIGFLDRHLIILADRSLSVWDIVDETQFYSVNLAPATIFSTWLLSVNHEDQTFAISTPVKTTSCVQICSPASANPQFSQVMQQPVSALLTVQGRRGYKVLNTAAEVFSLSPKATGPQLPSQRKRRNGKKTPTTSAIAVSAEVPEEMDTDLEPADVYLLENDEEADKPVVRPEQLASVFDRDNIALMPVREMFDAVVGLYARKPRVQTSSA